jgi:hypothetical protein
MPDAKDWGLEKRVNDKGRLELVDKDIVGKEYTALTCSGPEMTPADEEFLAVSDRERSNSKKFVDYFVKNRERVDQEQEARLGDDMNEAADRMALDLRKTQDFAYIRSQQGNGPGDAVHAENGATIPRKRVFTFDKEGHAELVLEVAA